MAAKPKTFSFHWGSGIVAEEAQVKTEHHIPTLQLLRYTDGPLDGQAAGSLRPVQPQGAFRQGAAHCLGGRHRQDA